VTPQLSLYLDLTRFVAALAVFISHFALRRLSGGELWRLGAYGSEAVTYFFVMSGYVIAFTTHTRERTAHDYVINRCARLYSVVLPTVLLTACLDWLGERINPSSYHAGWGFVQDLSFHRLLSALTFTNELWTQQISQGSNAAYWSLGYEAGFYFIFGVALFAPVRWRIAAVALALLAVGPSIAVAFPIWLAGWAAYRWGLRGSLSPRAGLWVFGLSLLAWLAYQVAVGLYGRPMLTSTFLFKRQELAQDYILTIIFVANLVGFQAASQQLGSWLLQFAGPIRWLAGATFTLYLCHEPIAQFLVACSPWPVGDIRSSVSVFALTMVFVFLLAEVTERRKSAWRAALLAFWPARTRP